MDEMMRDMMIMIQDLQRRMNNVLRPAPIVAIDPKANRVKVRFSDADPGRGTKAHDSAWLRVLHDRAGKTSKWSFPEIGEQVLVLSPGGELGGGYVLPSIFSAARPAPSDDPKLEALRFGDGFEFSYDQTTHKASIERPVDPDKPNEKKPPLFLVVAGTDINVTASNIQFTADKVTFTADKFAIKNTKGEEFLSQTSEALKTIRDSKTTTMMGSQPLLPALTAITPITNSIDSFKDT